MDNLNYGKLAANLNVKLDDELSKRFQIIFKGKDIASMPEHEVWQQMLSKLNVMQGAKFLGERNSEVCQIIQNKVKQYDARKADEAVKSQQAVQENVSKTKQAIKQKFSDEFNKFTVLETEKLNEQLKRVKALNLRMDDSTQQLSKAQPRVQDLTLTEKAFKVAIQDEDERQMWKDQEK